MDDELARRLADYLDGEPGLTEKKMFGGHAFLINGHMAVSASGQGGLLLRCDPVETETLVSDEEADRFIMRGREMNGWLHVHPSEATFPAWVDRGVAYARSLPPKE